MRLLGGHHREAFAEVEAHLVAEHRERAGARAVFFIGAVFKNVFDEIEVLFHGHKQYRDSEE